jgi:hypothetical protein
MVAFRRLAARAAGEHLRVITYRERIVGVAEEGDSRKE